MQRCIYLLWILIVSNQQLYSTTHNGWHNTLCIWNFGIIAACDSGLNKDPYTYFATDPSFEKDMYINAKPGDIVWLPCRFLGQFCKEVLPELRSSIVLVIADGDESFPSQGGQDFFLPTLLNHPCIIHIFAQNYECFEDNSKISHLPIGMDFHTVAYKSKTGGWGEEGNPQVQEQKLTSILQNLKPTYLRKSGRLLIFNYLIVCMANFNGIFNLARIANLFLNVY